MEPRSPENTKAPELPSLRGLRLVAGARNYLQANQPLEFRFEVTV
ncbi:MAG TPA: hypothetical protein VMK12_12765 [Anaeromyxobacteraceae bacterium]|nr:hypothetical protein [Anaeromyxobacteraceae bacterium]